MMFIKVHKAYRVVVAVCDSDILGKTFEEGISILDVRESFYKGEEKERDEMIELMRDLAMEDATFSIAGKDSVQAALDARIIAEEGVRTIAGVPFALSLL
jgi:uncharacterized protein